MSNGSDAADATGASSAPVLHDVPSLINFSTSVLRTLRLPDGVYCFDRGWAELACRGRSLRYTLMVALGFVKAERAGYPTPEPARELVDLVIAEFKDLTIGDLGLLLWVQSRLGDDRVDATLRSLNETPNERLVPLEGMEIAWVVTGLAEAVSSGAEAEPLLARMLGVLQSRASSKTPLYHHNGHGKGRALLPNFATEIYSVLALAEAGRASNDQHLIARARRLADHLVEHRGTDGGWPWLFNAETGSVAERHQIYSVHQDAMAPMAFFALAEASGDQRYALAAVEGLSWCFGNNELGFNFYDTANRFAHRAIRRKGWADRAELWSNTALSLTPLRKRLVLGSAAINTTCRPYHLGWILEGWVGREKNIELVTST